MNHVAWMPALALTVLATAPAIAADNGIYLGGSLGFSNVDVDEVDFSDDATGFKVIAGWRFLDWLSVEANYVGFGDVRDIVAGERAKADVDGYSLSALAFLPVGPVDMFARAGAISWDARLRSSGFTIGRDDGTDFTWGLGAQFRLGSLSLRAEYEGFELGDVDANMLSAGITWTFF